MVFAPEPGSSETRKNVYVLAVTSRKEAHEAVAGVGGNEDREGPSAGASMELIDGGIQSNSSQD